jgi:hypothetical protein
VAFSQLHLTPFDHYESAWRTENTGSNPRLGTRTQVTLSPIGHPADLKGERSAHYRTNPVGATKLFLLMFNAPCLRTVVEISPNGL